MYIDVVGGLSDRALLKVHCRKVYLSDFYLFILSEIVEITVIIILKFLLQMFFLLNALKTSLLHASKSNLHVWTFYENILVLCPLFPFFCTFQILWYLKLTRQMTPYRIKMEVRKNDTKILGETPIFYADRKRSKGRWGSRSDTTPEPGQDPSGKGTPWGTKWPVERRLSPWSLLRVTSRDFRKMKKSW